MIEVKQLDAQQADFWTQLDELLAWESVSDDKVFGIVTDVIANVRKRGDAAVVEYTNKFDRLNAKAMTELEISTEQLQQALQRIPAEQRMALEKSAERIRTSAGW